MPKHHIQTARLTLREFSLTDAPFILKLVNTPEWLEFIGDKHVHNMQDAEHYLTSGPMKSQTLHGYGLWAVELLDTHELIGMCGFVKRDKFDHPDIGFALMPNQAGKGFGFEMAAATLAYGRDTLRFPTILGITSPHNQRSISVLTKIGLLPQGLIPSDHPDGTLLFRLDFG
jgi:ribosomal-protein-alanine N-acetyltransferase